MMRKIETDLEIFCNAINLWLFIATRSDSVQ